MLSPAGQSRSTKINHNRIREQCSAEMRGVRTPAACPDRLWTASALPLVSTHCLSTPLLLQTSPTLPFMNYLKLWCIKFLFNNGGAEELGWCTAGRVSLPTTVGAGETDAAWSRRPRRLLHARWPASATSTALLPYWWEPARAWNQLWTEVSSIWN